MSAEAEPPKYPILDGIEIPEKVLENWQVMADLLAEIAKVPAALVMRVHALDIEVFVASHGSIYHSGEKASLDMGIYCETVMSTRLKLLVPNALKDPAWEHNPDIALGMISYCGLPINWPNGEIFGTICILDTRENTYIQRTQQLLEHFRDSLQLNLANIYETSIQIAGNKKLLHDLADNCALLRMAGQLARLGGWQIILPEKRVVWSDVVCDIHEMPHGTSPTLDEAIDYYAPESIEKIREMVNACINDGTPFDDELQFVTARGNRLWVHILGQAVRDTSGVITHVQGAFYDVTERKQIEEKLRWNVAVNDAMLGLSQSFVTMPQLVIEDISDRVLDAAKLLTGSEFGYVGYIDAVSGFLISPTLTRDIWDRCDVAGKSIVFEKWNGLWGWVLTNRRSLLSNSPSEDPRSVGIPQGHVPIESFISAPALAGGKLIGQISLANADRDYTERDMAAIERLADFYAIVVQRMRNERALKENGEMLGMSMKAAGAGAWKWDIATNRAIWSDENYRLMGLEPGSAESNYATWLKRVHHDDRENIEKQIVEAVAAKSDLDIEFRIVRPDGEVRWINDVGRIMLDKNGETVGMFGLQMDITERRRSEQALRDSIAEKEVMMREMHHRVKNNMQMMSNLLELQSAYVTDEKALGFFRDSQQRIQSMAMTHEQLYRNEDLSRIDFTAYLHGLVDNLCRQYGGSCNNVNITIDAQHCILPVDTAIPCGLVVNELVTNAMKHAFPNGRAGEINISLRVGGEGKIALEVADDGVGMPAEPGSAGFGMRLITLMVEKQLNGRLTIASNNPGTRVLCETGVQ